jgi:hypothetical protein
VIEVVLTEFELHMAAGVGARRGVNAFVNGRRQAAADVDSEGNWQQHIEGACGEMAVARVLNRYWNGSVGTFKSGGDVGDIQVRTRSKHHYDLIVRSRDRDEDWFILVTGTAPRYRVHGYVRAADAKKDEYRQNHGGHGEAWFVPAANLKPLKQEGA